ncbi:MAG: DMT family transporter [Burkholderiaceae bacterium]
MLHQDTAHNRLIGIGIASIAVLCFSVLDGLGKYLTQTLPVLQVVWLRFAIHVMLSAVFLAPVYRQRLFRTRRPGLQLFRATLMGAMTCMNFFALQTLQLAETGSIMFLAPLLIAALGWLLLDEKLDLGRWLAIAVGFAGVLVILQPGSGEFKLAMLLPLGIAFLIASFSMVSRSLAATDTPVTTQFLSGLGTAVVLAPVALWDWQVPAGWIEWTLLIALGAAGSIGHYCLALSFRYAPASTLAPFQYFQIFWMVAIGYLVFGDIPSAAVAAGSSIVIGSGLYLLYRESRVKAAPAVPADAVTGKSPD